jgi:hypothetical protein
MIGDLDRTAWFTDIIIRQQSGRVVSVVLMPSSSVSLSTLPPCSVRLALE